MQAGWAGVGIVMQEKPSLRMHVQRWPWDTPVQLVKDRSVFAGQGNRLPFKLQINPAVWPSGASRFKRWIYNVTCHLRGMPCKLLAPPLLCIGVWPDHGEENCLVCSHESLPWVLEIRVLGCARGKTTLSTTLPPALEEDVLCQPLTPTPQTQPPLQTHKHTPLPTHHNNLLVYSMCQCAALYCLCVVCMYMTVCVCLYVYVCMLFVRVCVCAHIFTSLCVCVCVCVSVCICVCGSGMVVLYLASWCKLHTGDNRHRLTPPLLASVVGSEEIWPVQAPRLTPELLLAASKDTRWRRGRRDVRAGKGPVPAGVLLSAVRLVPGCWGKGFNCTKKKYITAHTAAQC